MRAVHAGLSVLSREGRNHWALCTRGLLVHVVREEAASERICTAHQMWPCSQAKGWGRGARNLQTGRCARGVALR